MMSPAETVAAIMTLEHGRPWEFYRDLARHCWDEVWIVRREHGGDRKAAIAAGVATMDKRLGFMSQFATDGAIPDPYADRRNASKKGSATGY